jgi:hypothetical protein
MSQPTHVWIFNENRLPGCAAAAATLSAPCEGGGPMPDPTPNDCLSCRFALWCRTGTGRLHPSGDGRCTWKGWRDWKIPGSMYYISSHTPSGGNINRREPITACPCWEAIQDA